MGTEKKASKGFTLMEVVIATFLVATGIVALLSAFLSGLVLIESSRNMATAGADARTVFEEMRRLSAADLSSVLNGDGKGSWSNVRPGDWSGWARGTGLTALPNETVAVSFRNPNADPLEPTVTVNWMEKNRNRSARFTSLVTRR